MLTGFTWLKHAREAYCVTFAQGLDEAEILRRFGGDPAWAQVRQPDDWGPWRELEQLGQIIEIGVCDGWAFVYEDNGFEGTQTEILRAVSAGTTAVSVFRNVNAVTRFCYAEDGNVLANFDPIDPPFYHDLPQVQALLDQVGITPEFVYDDDEDYDFVEAMFELAEAAGVRLDRETIAEKPRFITILRNPFMDFVNDLLASGVDAQTNERLLAILSDQRLSWARQRMNYWLKPSPHWQRSHTEGLSAIISGLANALRSPQVMPALLTTLAEGPLSLRSAVAELLKAFILFEQEQSEKGSRERFFALTTCLDDEVVLLAALALGKLGDQHAIDPLLRMLASFPRQSTQARGLEVYALSHQKDIAQVLGLLRARDAVEPLFRLLDIHGTNIDFQRTLLEALARIGDSSIVAQLLPMLRPDSEDIHEESFQQALLVTLTSLGGDQLVDVFLNLLNPQPTALYTYDFQLHLLKALGNLGEQRVREPLAQLLTSDINSCTIYERSFQRSLIQALKQLGDTRPEFQALEMAIQQLEAKTKKVISINRQEPPNGTARFCQN